MNSSPDKKRCRGCRKSFSATLTHFNFCPTTSDGLSIRCKSCSRLVQTSTARHQAILLLRKPDTRKKRIVRTRHNQDEDE